MAIFHSYISLPEGIHFPQVSRFPVLILERSLPNFQLEQVSPLVQGYISMSSQLQACPQATKNGDWALWRFSMEKKPQILIFENPKKLGMGEPQIDCREPMWFMEKASTQWLEPPSPTVFRLSMDCLVKPDSKKLREVCSFLIEFDVGDCFDTSFQGRWFPVVSAGRFIEAGPAFGGPFLQWAFWSIVRGERPLSPKLTAPWWDVWWQPSKFNKFYKSLWNVPNQPMFVTNVSSISVNHLHIKFVFHSIRTHPEGFQSWHPILRCSRFIEDTSHVLSTGFHVVAILWDGLNGHPFWCFFGSSGVSSTANEHWWICKSSMPSIEPQFSCNSLGTV